MANKVIKIGSTVDSAQSSEQSSEVYVDVSIVAAPNVYDANNVVRRFKIDKKTNVRAVQGAIHNIFTWIPGERILNPEFGSNLRKLLYEGITQFNVEQIIAEIRHAVSVWEPRVQIEQVVNVGSTDDTEDNTVHLEVEYTIPGLTQDQIYSEPIVYTRS